jgi:hypothetical protein
MVSSKGYINYMYFLFVITFIVSILILSTTNLSYAKQDNVKSKQDNKDDKKLDVKIRIHLDNIDMKNTKLFRITGSINGEAIKKDVPISSADKVKKTLTVDLKLDSKNDIVNAESPDEFFVCAYPVGDLWSKDNSFQKFDCNEGDLLDIGTPTTVNLFRIGSQVYAKSNAVYLASLNQSISNSPNDKVNIKIYSPLADKKDTKKLKLVVALNGQIQSQLIEDVQGELDKSKDYIIKRIFTFDTKTDIGPIQVGDRYHACAISEDLRPPEGSECEKRVIKNLDKINELYVR